MLIDKTLIIDAKNELGDEGAMIIAKDLALQEWDEENLKSLCPFHDEDSPSFVWSRKDNAFKCFGCGMRYGIIDHYIQFEKLTYINAVKKLFEITNKKYSFGEQGVKTQRGYKYPNYDKSDDRSLVEDYLGKRKISKETLDSLDVQQDKHGNIVFNFYDVNDVLTLVKYRPSHKLKPKEDKTWCQVGADTTPILYNMNRIDFTNGGLLITEGECDCLSAIESGYKNTVSVPLGANNYGWIEKNWEWLELFDKIIIWSDSDEAGMKMRKEVCSRLGAWRTFYVDAPEQVLTESGEEIKVKDINEILYHCGKQKVLDLINTAKELPVIGLTDLSTVEDFDIETEQGLFTGLKPVDKTIYKFFFGSTVLVTGKKGSGKSTLLNQCFICEPLNQGHDVFIFSGELGKKVVRNWLELTMIGGEKIRMKGDFVHVVDKSSLKIMKEWYHARSWIYDQPSNKLEDILNMAITATRRYGVKVWLLDNLMTIDLGANSNDILEKQKNLMVELNRLALLYNVLIILVAHPRKLPSGQEIEGDDIAGSGSLGNLAQYILSVKRYDEKDKEGVKARGGGWVKGKEPFKEDVAINIMKNRYTGKIGEVRMFFDYASYRFFSCAEELFKRYKWNKDESPTPRLEEYDKRFAQPDFMKEG